MNFFHLIFPCANVFFVLRPPPPPPHKFSNGPSLIRRDIPTMRSPGVKPQAAINNLEGP